MPAPVTTLDQLSDVYKTPNGQVRFRITSSLIELAPGDLPQLQIFVFSIVAANDPKADVFVRIGNISDLTTLPRARDVAIAQNVSTYLAASFVVEYENVQTATTAKQLIQARVDQLISDWKLYTQAFTASRETELPLSNANAIAAAKNSYYAAVAAQAKKEAELAGTAADYQAKALEAEYTRKKLDDAKAAAAECQSVKLLLDAAILGEDAHRSAVSGNAGVTAAFVSFRTEASAWTAASATDKAAKLATADAAITSIKAASASEAVAGQAKLAQLQAQLAASCQAKQLAQAQAEAQATTASTAAAAAQTAWNAAQQAATAAQATTAQALQNALAVCPDFIP